MIHGQCQQVRHDNRPCSDDKWAYSLKIYEYYHRDISYSVKMSQIYCSYFLIRVFHYFAKITAEKNMTINLYFQIKIV